MFASLTLSSTPNVYVKHNKVSVSAENLGGRGVYHAREAESEVTLNSKSDSSTVKSFRQSENVVVLNAGSQLDEDTDGDISSLSSTDTGRKLTLSESGVPQDAGVNHIQSASENQSSEINITSTTLMWSSSDHSIESSLVTIQGECSSQDVATDQACQCFSNELAERAHHAVESREGRRKLETENESKFSSTTHSHSIRTVERSTSETTVSKIDRQMDQDTDVLALPLSQITRLPPSSPVVPQDAGADSIQSRCEHRVITASTTVVQTSNHDCSTETKGYRLAQSFSHSDEPAVTLSTHICLSLAQNNSSSPPSMDKAVENAQTSSNER
ncbi:hypothetical protein BDR07DRAFT_556103 [Suillus spraguei]|nr:hypothetical protein BDR07DRAFT_556103 [Suillus spraguei]